MTKRPVVGVVVCSLALIAGVLPVAVAWADPSRCRADTTSFDISSIGQMRAQGEGNCAEDATRTLRVEIKHDINFRPDALVAANSQTSKGTYYNRVVSSCDNGNYATYYGRTFFTTNTTYHDSDHHKWHVC